MKVYDIYQQYPIALVKASGMDLWDEKGNKYLDFYGGHGVISIGHSHPEFVKSLTHQLSQIAFYSNAFINPLQNELASLLGKLSGYNGYCLFMSNSGAEANENALKTASFYTQRNKVLAVKGAFHGRSAAAVAVTDNPGIQAPFGSQLDVDFVEFDNIDQLTQKLSTKQYAAFIIEGIQGVNGVFESPSGYWQAARELCTRTGTILIADEIQSGYARSGKFFAHQYHNISADIVTTAKGMGNGFPVGGTLIAPELQLAKGKLGTTFGGGQLACAAAISVLKVIETENLIINAAVQGGNLKNEIAKLDTVKEVRGRGLMLGIDFEPTSGKKIRDILLNEFGIITGFSSPEILRILPPLNVTPQAINIFLSSLKQAIEKAK